MHSNMARWIHSFNNCQPTILPEASVNRSIISLTQRISMVSLCISVFVCRFMLIGIMHSFLKPIHRAYHPWWIPVEVFRKDLLQVPYPKALQKSEKLEISQEYGQINTKLNLYASTTTAIRIETQVSIRSRKN